MNHPRLRGGGTALKHTPRTGVPRDDQATAARSRFFLNHPRSRGGGTALQTADDRRTYPVYQQIRAMRRSAHRLQSEIGTRAELRCELVTSQPSFDVAD